MAFPAAFMDNLIARSDIVDIVGGYVALNKRGGDYWGCCPFHNEKTPSFHVVPDRQMYYCFGCKKGGGVLNFIMEIENLPYPDAVRFLAKRAGLEVPENNQTRDESRQRARILALNRDAARFYHQLLKAPEGQNNSTRPNQLFAVALPYSPLSEEVQDMVERQLMSHGAYEVAKRYIT